MAKNEYIFASICSCSMQVNIEFDSGIGPFC